MKPAIIFDIDGTLADITHRLHYVRGEHKNWDRFFSEMDKDKPHEEIVHILLSLWDSTEGWGNLYYGYDILFVSGRPEKYRETTLKWLTEVACYGTYQEDIKLYMRPDDDTRPDYIVKSQILDGIIDDGYDVKLVFDDRKSVVDMWRSRGITCLQVREDHEVERVREPTLYIMVGPSGSGKTTYVENQFCEECIVSSDSIRIEMLGSMRDQSKNDQVFAALHDIVRTRLRHGLDTVVDATNIRSKDRKTVAALANGGKVVYIVIDRPMEEKRRDGGWRNELGFDLLAKHQQTFDSNLKDILRGDGLPNVTVIDYRSYKK